MLNNYQDYPPLNKSLKYASSQSGAGNLALRLSSRSSLMGIRGLTAGVGFELDHSRIGRNKHSKSTSGRREAHTEVVGSRVCGDAILRSFYFFWDYTFLLKVKSKVCLNDAFRTHVIPCTQTLHPLTPLPHLTSIHPTSSPFTTPHPFTPTHTPHTPSPQLPQYFPFLPGEDALAHRQLVPTTSEGSSEGDSKIPWFETGRRKDA